jgi:hypothetical protein
VVVASHNRVVTKASALVNYNLQYSYLSHNLIIINQPIISLIKLVDIAYQVVNAIANGWIVFHIPYNT